MKRESRVIKVGGTVYVRLPKDWVDTHGIQARDTLTIEYDDEAVTVRAPKLQGNDSWQPAQA